MTLKSEALQTFFSKGELVKKDDVFYRIIKPEDMNCSGDAYIPLSYMNFKDNSVYVTVLYNMADCIIKFICQYREELFNLRSFGILFDMITPELEKCGYEVYTGNNEKEKYMNCFAMDQNKKKQYIEYIDKNNIIQKDTIPFTSADNHVNITNSYIGYSEHRQCFGTLINSKIVSVCGTNIEIYKYPSTKTVEIGVDTNIDYRQNGYAKSNTASMAKWLLTTDICKAWHDGYNILYNCNSFNIASEKNARAVGFELLNRQKLIWVTKKEEID